MRVLVIDAANVVGARPNGWWRDRAAAARALHQQVLVADLDHDQIVMVLEGAAKGGVKAGTDQHVLTVHAPKDGDSEIVRRVKAAAEAGHRVELVTSDRMLAALASASAMTFGASWLLDRL